MNIIKKFFATHKALSVAEIEREADCPLNTVNAFLSGQRGMPVKHTINVVAVLARYGFQPKGWRLEYDDLTRTFIAEKPVPDTEIQSEEVEPGHFQYKVAYYRELIGDVFDLIDWMETIQEEEEEKE